MTRDEAQFAIRDKLLKSENLFTGYSKGNMSLHCLCSNLASRILNFIELELKMEPPKRDLLAGFDTPRLVNLWDPPSDEDL